jgi:hypothetical protein
MAGGDMTYSNFLKGQIPNILSIITLPMLFTFLVKDARLMVAIAIGTIALLYLYLESQTVHIDKKWSKNNIIVISITVVIANILMFLIIGHEL